MQLYSFYFYANFANFFSSMIHVEMDFRSEKHSIPKINKKALSGNLVLLERILRILFLLFKDEEITQTESHRILYGQ
jgi:hypothetical protein